MYALILQKDHFHLFYKLNIIMFLFIHTKFKSVYLYTGRFNILLILFITFQH